MREDGLSAQILGEILADAYADSDVTEGLDVMTRAAELKEETEKVQQTNKKQKKTRRKTVVKDLAWRSMTKN